MTTNIKDLITKLDAETSALREQVRVEIEYSENMLAILRNQKEIDTNNIVAAGDERIKSIREKAEADIAAVEEGVTANCERTTKSFDALIEIEEKRLTGSRARLAVLDGTSAANDDEKVVDLGKKKRTAKP
jgi:hypothetical protein